jgi:hypothetical protein
MIKIETQKQSHPPAMPNGELLLIERTAPSIVLTRWWNKGEEKFPEE